MLFNAVWLNFVHAHFHFRVIIWGITAIFSSDCRAEENLPVERDHSGCWIVAILQGCVKKRESLRKHHFQDFPKIP